MIEAEANECVRRASGRRIDPQTGNIYHLEENPPPTDVKGLADRLQPINDADTNENKIKESYDSLKQNKESLENWFKKFGFEEQRFPTFVRFNS